MDFVLVPKNTLMLIAGTVWCLAGGMVSGIGLPLLWGYGPAQPLLYPLAVVIFLIFYLLIFSKLVVKHTGRIRAVNQPKLPFWNFFDLPSYIVMAIMMSGGMWLRLAHVIPNWTIAFFYSGLGVALFACGVRFLSVYSQKRVLVASQTPQSLE